MTGTGVKLKEIFNIIAYNDKGYMIAKKECEKYPPHEELEQFANGYQQADFIQVEKKFRYVR